MARALEGVGGGRRARSVADGGDGARGVAPRRRGRARRGGEARGGGIAVGRVGGDAPGGVGRPGFQVARGGGAQARRARVARDLRKVPPRGGAATGAAASTGAGGVFGRQRGGAPFARGEPTRVLPLLQVRQAHAGADFEPRRAARGDGGAGAGADGRGSPGYLCPNSSSSANSSVGSSFTGGGTGGAMATAGNDDRLYVFEAFGLLLGIDDVPDDLRIRCLEAVFARLRGRWRRGVESRRSRRTKT